MDLVLAVGDNWGCKIVNWMGGKNKVIVTNSLFYFWNHSINMTIIDNRNCENMINSTSKYTPSEILEIFKEQHRLCSPLDPDADPSATITPEMTIYAWRLANDLMGWKKLSQFLNQEFRLNLSEQEWYANLEPSKQRQLIDVCRLISKYAHKENYEPKILFGHACLKGTVFLTIKKNLQKKGVNVSNLRPSSALSDYLLRYFLPMIEEITLTGTRPIEKIEVRRKKKGFWNTINIFDADRFEILTGEVKTFRELIEQIVDENRKIAHHKNCL